jgi:hypothetical protein
MADGGGSANQNGGVARAAMLGVRRALIVVAIAAPIGVAAATAAWAAAVNLLPAPEHESAPGEPPERAPIVVDADGNVIPPAVAKRLDRINAALLLESQVFECERLGDGWVVRRPFDVGILEPLRPAPTAPPAPGVEPQPQPGPAGAVAQMLTALAADDLPAFAASLAPFRDAEPAGFVFGIAACLAVDDHTIGEPRIDAGQGRANVPVTWTVRFDTDRFLREVMPRSTGVTLTPEELRDARPAAPPAVDPAAVQTRAWWIAATTFLLVTTIAMAVVAARMIRGLRRRAAEPAA